MKRDQSFKYSKEAYNRALKEQAAYNFFGFTVYDIVHILWGLYFLIYYAIMEPSNHLEIAECVVEIVVSVTLIGFIHAIASEEHGESMNRTYTYAWLLASVSLLTPALFKGVGLTFREMSPIVGVEFAVLIVCMLMYALFFTCLFTVKRRTLWMAFLYLGMVFFAITAVLEFVDLLLNGYPSDPHEIVNFWLLSVKLCIPLVPAILGIVGLYKVDRQINGKLL